jgi:hypothetical protein
MLEGTEEELEALDQELAAVVAVVQELQEQTPLHTIVNMVE